jgi:uncharacterized metal-binding protein
MAGKKVKYSKYVPELEVPAERKPPKCDQCPIIACWPRDPVDVLKGPDNCPTKNFPDLIQKAKEIYLKDGIDRKMQLLGARLEGMSSSTPPGGSEINMSLTRIEELLVFCKMMDWKKIGFAHCIGLKGEATELSTIFSARGFETYQVCCKVGGIEKTEIGIAEDEKVRMLTYESICNNIAQALILNEIGTDLNIVLGLCVGHDITFSMHSKAPVTTLIVKDRRTGNNPAVALYTAYPPCNFYYGRLLKSTSETCGR